MSAVLNTPWDELDPDQQRAYQRRDVLQSASLYKPVLGNQLDGLLKLCDESAEDPEQLLVLLQQRKNWSARVDAGDAAKKAINQILVREVCVQSKIRVLSQGDSKRHQQLEKLLKALDAEKQHYMAVVADADVARHELLRTCCPSLPETTAAVNETIEEIKQESDSITVH